MTASENKEIVRKLRRAAEGNLPEWAQMAITMPEIRDLVLLVDTIADLRRHQEIRADVIRDRNAERSALHARVAELEALLGEVLRTFVHPGHPGRACLQSGWIPVETVTRWRAALGRSS